MCILCLRYISSHTSHISSAQEPHVARVSCTEHQGNAFATQSLGIIWELEMQNLRPLPQPTEAESTFEIPDAHQSLREMGPVLPKILLWLPTALMINVQLLNLAIVHSLLHLLIHSAHGY